MDINIIQNVWRWFFSTSPTENPHVDEVERLEMTMKTTAINRYNASNRLKWQGKIAFATTTILSLGLVFIPLVQIANIPLVLNSSILAAMQIFLAVSVLVYSVVIGTARYDLRSEQLNDCGDKLKSLIRDLRHEKERKEGEIEKEYVDSIKKRYSDISTSVENHTRNDFLLTQLRNNDAYTLTGAIRLISWGLYWLAYFVFNLTPLILLSIEFVFILDMFGATQIFSPFLLGEYIAP